LPLAERVLLVAVYQLTNLTMRQLAPLFGVSPATVCLVIQYLAPLPRSRSGERRTVTERGARHWYAEG
jgi:hypothetical protein